MKCWHPREYRRSPPSSGTKGRILVRRTHILVVTPRLHSLALTVCELDRIYQKVAVSLSYVCPECGTLREVT